MIFEYSKKKCMSRKAELKPLPCFPETLIPGLLQSNSEGLCDSGNQAPGSAAGAFT